MFIVTKKRYLALKKAFEKYTEILESQLKWQDNAIIRKDNENNELQYDSEYQDFLMKLLIDNNKEQTIKYENQIIINKELINLNKELTNKLKELQDGKPSTTNTADIDGIE